MALSDPLQRRVALYARTANDIRVPNSVETQLSVCRIFAQRQGWRIEMTLCDRNIGGQGAARPAFQALHGAVETGTIDIVLFVALDRLGRDPGLVRRFQKTANARKVELHQVHYGKADLLDLAMLSESAFRRLATRRAERMRDLAASEAPAPSR